MSVEEELEELLRAEAPAREDVEAVLTHGHAVVLELEAERLKLHKRLDRARAMSAPALDGVIAAMNEELVGVTARLQSLHGGLGEVGRRFGPRRRLSDRVR